jgi:BirA family biotin operon repressor/biotin-[acetyl-CoA-carboxylase] ligase
MTVRHLPAPLRLLGYDSLGSTNDEAKRLAAEGAAAWTVVWARAQSAGRGRRQRPWVSQPGNLFVSVLLRPPGPAVAVAQLGFAAALAVGDTLAPLLAEPGRLRYKWPNDVLVGGRKIAGILLESAAARDGVDWLVAGIGVNIASHPAEAATPATSLAALGATADLETVLAALLTAFHAWAGRWESEGFEPLRRAWLERAQGLGHAIGVRLERESFTGRFVDLDRDGALLVETDAGRRRIAAGEVFPAAA